MSSIDEILDRRTPNTVTVEVSLRNDLRAQIETLEEQLEDAQEKDRWQNRIPQAPEIATRIIDLRDQMRAEAVRFRFRELPRVEWERLVRAHPPRQEDTEVGAAWNADTFPPAVLAACAADPEMTPETAQRLWDEWPLGEVRRLWQACLTVNSGAGQVPLASTATRLIRSTAGNSTTAAPEESPDPSF